MQTHELFPSAASNAFVFSGAEYVEARDYERLTTQVARVHGVAIDGKFRTIQKLVAELAKRYPRAHFPENSVQAQLRNLKKIGFRLTKRNVAEKGFLCEFQLLPPLNPGVGLEMRNRALGVKA